VEILKLLEQQSGQEAPAAGLTRLSGEPLNRVQKLILKALPGTEVSRVSHLNPTNAADTSSGFIAIQYSNGLMRWEELIPAYSYLHHTVSAPIEARPNPSVLGPSTRPY
jgi:hypothetical protein